ncbi:MAG: SLC13 family permease [Thermoplasmata archaeon]
MLGASAYGAVGLFAIAYVLFALWERYRVLIAGVAAAALLASGLVPLARLVPAGWNGSGSIISWDTLGLLTGLFLFAALLSELNFFQWAAIKLAARTHGRPLQLYLSVTLLSFVLAAFINSIAVLVVLAAITIQVARAVGQNPGPLLIAEISAANIGGAATLVGDPPNVILGSYFGLSFSDFLLHAGLPAIAALAVLLLWFGRSGGRELHAAELSLPTLPGQLERGWVIATFAGFVGMLVAFQFQAALGLPVWAIGVVGGLVALALSGAHRAQSVMRHVDWEVLAFFLFLFVLVGGLESTGVISAAAGGIASVGAGNLLLTGTILLWTLGLLSTVVNSVPLAAAAAPLIAQLGSTSGLSVAPLVFASSLGTDIGGSGTPIGASANLVGLAAADRAGVKISWRTYTKLAFPAMLASLAVANLIWLVAR